MLYVKDSISCLLCPSGRCLAGVPMCPIAGSPICCVGQQHQRVARMVLHSHTSQQHSRHEQIDLFCCSSVMIWLNWWLGLAQLSPTHTGPCRVCIIISSTRHQQHPGIGTCSHYNCSSMQSLSSVRDASALMVKAPQSVELNKRANLCPAVAFSSLFVCQSCQLDWDFSSPTSHHVPWLRVLGGREIVLSH